LLCSRPSVAQMDRPKSEVLARMRAPGSGVPLDKLDRVRDAIRRLRDLLIRKEEASDLVKEISREVTQIEQSELVDLFDEAGIEKIVLPPEGNLPGYSAKAQPYYYACIQAGWPPDQREAAFKWLEDRQCGDLIKTVVTVELGLGEAEKTKKLVEALRAVGVAYDVRKSVPWNTLTAFAREQAARLSLEDKETLGAVVGRIVKVTRRKDDG